MNLLETLNLWSLIGILLEGIAILASVAKGELVTITVYDMLGNVVKNFVNAN